MTADFASALLLVTIVLAGAAAYAARLTVRGRARSERVDREATHEGARMAMEGGMWMLAPVVRGLVAAGVSANAVTLASVPLALGAAVALGTHHYGVGAAFVVAAGLADVLDGSVARMTGTAGPSGKVLDTVVDRYVDVLVFGGAAFALRESALGLAIALSALVAALVVSYASSVAREVGAETGRGAMRRAERLVVVVLALAASALGVGTGLLDGALADAPVLAALGLVGVVGNVSAVARLLRSTRPDAVGFRGRDSDSGVRAIAARASAPDVEAHDDEADHEPVHSAAG